MPARSDRPANLHGGDEQLKFAWMRAGLRGIIRHQQMKQRRYILAALLIAIIALLLRRDAKQPPSDSGKNPTQTITRTQANIYTAPGRRTPAITNSHTSAARPAGGRLQPGPLVAPNFASDFDPRTNTATNTVAGHLPAGFIPPPHTPLVPTPAGAGRTDAPVVPPGFDRPRSSP